jgi:hypothetical protein
MRNHAFVEEVASKMLLYNNNEYLIDIDEVITTNLYGSTISNLLANIKNILTNELFNNNIDIKITKNSLKKYIFQILLFENGHKCCLEII